VVNDEVKIIDILSFVGIDKHQVELSAKLWHYLVAVAYVQRNAVAYRRFCKMTAQEVFQFILYLDAVNYGVVIEQSLGKALRRVARVSAEFKHPLGAYHAHEHLQQSALQMPRAHARVEQLYVSVSVKLMQMLRLGIDVGKYVIFKFLCHGANKLTSKQAQNYHKHI
jgi:hypothetical protein